MLSCPHCGQVTILAFSDSLVGMDGSDREIAKCMAGLPDARQSGAQSELKIRINCFGRDVPLCILLHHAHSHNQAVGTDFWNGLLLGADLQAQELKSAPLRQIVLKHAVLRCDFLGLPRAAH